MARITGCMRTRSTTMTATPFLEGKKQRGGEMLFAKERTGGITGAGPVQNARRDGNVPWLGPGDRASDAAAKAATRAPKSTARASTGGRAPQRPRAGTAARQPIPGKTPRESTGGKGAGKGKRKGETLAGHVLVPPPLPQTSNPSAIHVSQQIPTSAPRYLPVSKNVLATRILSAPTCQARSALSVGACFGNREGDARKTRCGSVGEDHRRAVLEGRRGAGGFCAAFDQGV